MIINDIKKRMLMLHNGAPSRGGTPPAGTSDGGEPLEQTVTPPQDGASKPMETSPARSSLLHHPRYSLHDGRYCCVQNIGLRTLFLLSKIIASKISHGRIRPVAHVAGISCCKQTIQDEIQSTGRRKICLHWKHPVHRIHTSAGRQSLRSSIRKNALTKFFRGCFQHVAMLRQICSKMRMGMMTRSNSRTVLSLTQSYVKWLSSGRSCPPTSVELLCGIPVFHFPKEYICGRIIFQRKGAPCFTSSSR